MIGSPARRQTAAVALALMLGLVLALPQTVLGVRVITYNILNFPGSTGTQRVPDFRLVMEELDADVLVVQEILSQTGVNQFLNDVMNYDHPGRYAAGPFVDGYDTDNALFYRESTVEFISAQQITTALRDISEYVLKPVGYDSPEAEFRVYSMHLKAGSEASDKDKRLAEATILRNYLNEFPAGSNLMIAGDLNIQGSSESAYQKLVGYEPDNDGRTNDPIDRPGYWHENHLYADTHTQSPRTTTFGGGAPGGLDDRFDQILVSDALEDGIGLSFVPDAYVAYGNDGNHMNQAINYGVNTAVDSIIADAIHDASDHIPLYADFQVPAKIDAASEIAFGNVIVGYSAGRPLTVANVANAPADELTYVLAAPLGFSVPVGPYELEAGDEYDHDVTMDTATPGLRSGVLMVQSNDLDTPDWEVLLEGTTLDHAEPSLRESLVVYFDTLDFGSHPVGGFEGQVAEIFNYGYAPLVALLDVYGAEIIGADGRFSFAGGFVSEKVGAAPAEYTLQFDANGAAEDSLYVAELTFLTADDPDVYGAVELSDLVVRLAAYVETGGTGVEELAALEMSLVPAASSPFAGPVVLALTLPEPGRARVTVYDVRGRLVRTLLVDDLPAGVHDVPWDGRDSDGRRMASGVYFVRAQAGERSDAAKVVLIR